MASSLPKSPSTAHPFTTQDLTQDTTNGVANPFLSLPTEMLLKIFQHVIAGCTPKEAAVHAIALGRVSCLLHTLTHDSSIESVINRAKHAQELDDALIILWTRCIAPTLADEVAGLTAEEIRAWMKDPANMQHLGKFLEIDLSNCKLKVIPPEICRLFCLARLHLNNNQITEINPSTFAGCTNLTVLQLNNNQITEINPSTFAGCLSLRELHLRNNLITKINPLTFADCPDLRGLRLNNNQIVQIAPNAFAGCKALRELELSNNQIVQIAPDAFAGCTALQWLCLNNNQIVQIDPSTFAGCLSLLELYLNNNQIVQIDPSTFAGCLSLEKLYLNNNQIVQIASDAFAGCKNLQQLDLDNNLITQIAPSTFAGCLSLLVLHLNHNQITLIDPSTFAGCLSLQVLHLHNNQITLIAPSTFAGCLSLQVLHLHNNQITLIAPSTFAGCTALITLRLGHNLITLIDPSTFADCKDLAELDLEHNQIVQIPPGTFARCPQLLKLHLASSSLLCVLALDEQNIQQTLKAFSRYTCKSPWAKLYKEISEGRLLKEAIVSELQRLKERNLIYEMVYREAKETAELKGEVFSDGGEHQWGEHHVCDDMPIFSRALKRAIRAKYGALSPAQKTSVHRKIYEMDKQTRGDLVDRGNDPIKWAKEHREDHVLRFLDVMDQL